MKRFLLPFAFIFLAALFACSKNAPEDVCKYWEGYLSNAEGVRVQITINFTGREIHQGSDKILKAERLVITGDTFKKEVEFKSPDGSKSLKSWVFTTQSQDPAYPYGIVSISSDYKDITGQLPDTGSLNTFYSVNDIST